MSDSIVIGATMGDEAKGLLTHNLCSPTSLVVRFSGGQQAGHTVIHNGVKHVFSSFGAGTMKGCATFFTEDTTIYPKTISAEWQVLKDKGLSPKLYVHPLAKVTTPYDVWVGRVSERRLSHGSCGLGVGATMKRNEGPIKLYAIDLLGPKGLIYEKMCAIKQTIEVEDNLSESDWHELQDDLDQFNEAISNRRFDVCRFDQLPDYGDIVFEGSQGVLLDMDHGVFPHVTYANTTSKNAWKYARRDTQVYYATRCYSTRHGNGPFAPSDIKLINIEHEINVPNTWQGEFKVGEIDYSAIRHAINVDLSYHPRDIDLNLVVSCLDQRPGFSFDFPLFGSLMKSKGLLFKGAYGNSSPHSGNLTRIR